MAALATIVPPIEWSQRKDGLYVVIKVAEATDVTVDLQAVSYTHLTLPTTPYV